MIAAGGTDRDAGLVRALGSCLEPGTSALLAVSGGPDSTAMMHAAARCGGRLHVATVDHGLRPEARAEAEAVGRLAAALALPHAILRWEAPRRASRIQEAARDARYRLLVAEAGRIGADRILTAHTLDDQAETVLMRLIAGSGPAGLAGMATERVLAPNLRLLRPLLATPKADLVAYCEAHGLAYLRDPSNRDTRFARARLRRLMPLLEAEGLHTGRLARLATRAARDEAALQERARTVLERIARPDVAAVTLDGAGLLAAPPAICLRVVALALARVEAAPRMPRLERLETLILDELLPALREGRRLRRTLGTVLLDVEAGGGLRLTPAPPRRGRAGDGLAAPTPVLLGKGEGRAYIGRERVGTVAPERNDARTPPRTDR